MQKLNVDSYKELSSYMIRVKQIQLEMKETNSYKGFTKELKQIALRLDIMFGYENRVISGNLAYDIAYTDKSEVWYVVYKNTKLLQKYIYQGVYNLDYQKGLDLFIEVHKQDLNNLIVEYRKNLLYCQLLWIKDKYIRG